MDKAKNYAYNLLRIRPRSESELRLRLAKKGFNRETSDETISILKKANLIDDLKFAKAWVDSRLKLSPKGDIVLRHELKEKGISSKIIEQVLSSKEENEQDLVSRLAEERYERIRDLPKLKAKKRLHDYLARRGFKYEIIEKAINEAFGHQSSADS